MITTNNAFIGQKNAAQNRPIWLYTFYDYDGSTEINLAEYNADVTFDGVTYTSFAITHDVVSESMTGEVNTLNLTVGNVNRLFQSYLETYDLRSKKVLIRKVWADELDDPDCCLDTYLWIETYVANDNTVSFVLASKFDVMDMQLPRGTYNRNTCRWIFKGTECAYAGAETSCNKTFQRCIALSNFARYGGIPAIPVGRSIQI